MTLLQCAQAPSKPGPLPENKDGSLQIIVEEGESAQPVYSTKGDKLLFISKRRRNHSQDQVYEKNLSSGVERRITFQTGNTYLPRYHPKGDGIVYSSSTDELKEFPHLLHPSTDVSKLPFPYQEQMELYAHAFHGFEITRLTSHPGFDGEARFNPDGRTLTFTRVSNQKTEIFELNRSAKSLRALKGLGVNPTQFVTSPDGKTHAWIEWDESFGVGRLRMQKGKDKIQEIGTDRIVTKTDLNFSPDSKWLLWSQHDEQKSLFDVWALDLDSVCPYRLTSSSEGDRRDPTLSPDLHWLTFTLVLNGRSRIARIGFAAPAGPCSDAP